MVPSSSNPFDRVHSYPNHGFRCAGITFTPRNIVEWLNTFPVPEVGPAIYVKDLRFSIEGASSAPEEFFEHAPWFTNARKMSLEGYIMYPSLGITSFARLPQSVTSLTIDAGRGRIELVQIRNIMVHLPNLNDLAISGIVVARSKSLLPGLGAALKGRFGGEFRLGDGYTNEDVVNMLLGVPTGLHFTTLNIYPNRACLLQTVRVAEACRKTLVELSYVGFIQGEPRAPPEV